MKKFNINRHQTLLKRTSKLIAMRNRFLDSMWCYYLIPFSKKWKRIEKCLDRVMKERFDYDQRF